MLSALYNGKKGIVVPYLWPRRRRSELWRCKRRCRWVQSWRGSGCRRPVQSWQAPSDRSGLRPPLAYHCRRCQNPESQLTTRTLSKIKFSRGANDELWQQNDTGESAWYSAQKTKTLCWLLVYVRTTVWVIKFKPLKFFELYFSKTKMFKAIFYTHVRRSNLRPITKFYLIILKFGMKLCHIMRVHSKNFPFSLKNPSYEPHCEVWMTAKFSDQSSSTVDSKKVRKTNLRRHGRHVTSDGCQLAGDSKE